MVAACEVTWRAFQENHPELPDTVIVLGSGVHRGRLVKLGHWWGGRWEADGELRGEVLLAGEALHLPVEDVFQVLLHEAAHGLNAVRGVKDTSRGGRYHNARYKAAAIEVGLDVEQQPPYGWARTALSPTTGDRYASEIASLRDAIRIARRLESRTAISTREPGQGETSHGSSAERRPKTQPLICGCGRRMRMAPSVASQGPVLCGVCGSEFATPQANVGPTQTSSGSGVVHLRPVGAERSVPDPESAESASRIIRRALDSDGGVQAVARAAAWANKHGESLDQLLPAATQAEADQLNTFARAFRRLQGHLDGPDVAAGDFDLAAGDHVVVRAASHASGSAVVELPEVGVLGQVVAVDSDAKSLTVDFPIAGRYQITTDEAGRHLALGYAMPGRLEVLPARLEPSLPAVDDLGPVAEVVEIDLP